MKAQLMLHAGGIEVSRDRVLNAPTPERTETWVPVPHRDLIETVEGALGDFGWTVARERHGLWKEDKRYFGVFDLTGHGLVAEDYTVSLGLRNSHDQSMTAAMVLGSRVFVCDNLAFSGEVQISHKHTTHIFRKLPALIVDAMAKVKLVKERQDARIASYKTIELQPATAHDFLIRSLDAGVVHARQVPAVLQEYREPRHPEFQPRTAWSLFNAYTEVFKQISVADLPTRTQRLHVLMDALAS